MMDADWPDAMVEGSLEWSFLRFADLDGLAELRQAIEYFDEPIQHFGLPELVESFHRPHAHPERSAVVGREKGGTIVAYAWNVPSLPDDPRPQVWLHIGVHPAWRHQRLRHRLLAWSLNRAKEWYAQIAGPSTGPLWVGCTAEESQAGITHSLVEAGLTPQRWFFDMYRPLDAGHALPDTPPGEGVRLVSFDMRHAEPVRTAHNEIFGSLPGARPVSRMEWEASLSSPEFRAEFSWVAVADHDHPRHPHPEHGRVVGYALNRVYEEESQGWTERLGVCPYWRGRGTGSALLVASMRSFVASGLTTAGIGVDTERPADVEQLFGSVGFESRDHLVLYGRSVQGEDLRRHQEGTLPVLP